MAYLIDLNGIKAVMNYEFLGIYLKDPVFFCIKVAIIILFVKFLLWLSNMISRRALKRKNSKFYDETSAKFIMRIVTTIVYILGVASILSLIPALEKIGTSILASAGILAMAVGLASQEALSNIVGGIFIIFAKPFRIGDFIEVDGAESGTVSEITLRHTVIRNAENRMIIIPNSKISSSTIINSTVGEPATCAFVEVGVSYNEDLNKCISVMRDEVEKHPMLIDHRTEEEKAKNTEKVIIRITNLGDSAITMRAYAWANTPGNAFTMKCDLLKSIKERFDKENIEIPYPYFNQIVKNA